MAERPRSTLGQSPQSPLNPQATDFKPLNLQPALMNLVLHKELMYPHPSGAPKVTMASPAYMPLTLSVHPGNTLPSQIFPSARRTWQIVGPNHYPPLDFDQMAHNVNFNAAGDIDIISQHKPTRGGRSNRLFNKIEKHYIGHNLLDDSMEMKYGPDNNHQRFTFTNATHVHNITARIHSHPETNDFITEMEHKMLYARANDLPLIYAKEILGSEYDSETMPFLAQYFMKTKDREADIEGRETAAREFHFRVLKYRNTSARAFPAVKEVRDGLIRDLVIGWFSGQSKNTMLEPWKYGHAVVVFRLQSLTEGELAQLFNSIGQVVRAREGAATIQA